MTPASAERAEERAKAAAVMVNLTTEEANLVVAIEDDGEGLDPLAKCEALWRSVEEDWPGWRVAYVANDAAKEMATARRLWQVGMLDDDDPMKARIEAHNAECQEAPRG